MKGKIFKIANTYIIELEDGSTFQMLSVENKKQFVERVRSVVENDRLEDLEIEEVDVEKLRNLSVEELLKKYESSIGLELNLISSIIRSKNSKIIETSEMKKAKSNISAVLEFKPFRKDTKMIGQIVKVVEDKKFNKLYYKVMGADGQTYQTSVKNASHKILKKR